MVVGSVNRGGPTVKVGETSHVATRRHGDFIRLLVPLYIVYAGLSVDVSRLAQPRLLLATLLVTLMAVITK